MLTAFFEDRAGQAAVAIFVVGLLQFLLQQAAAIRDSKFEVKDLTKWLRETFVGVIAPIWLLLFVGWAARDVSLIGDILLLSAIAWSGIYVAEVIKDIIDTWLPKRPPPSEGPS